MNQEGYSTSCSRTKVPTNSTSTTTKKRSYSRESDAGTPEQFPNKMFNVELFLTSNQAQCNFTTPQKQSEVDGSQGSEKDKMEQIQRRVKQSKRNITKAIEKFISNIEHYEEKYPRDDEMDQTGSAQINHATGILKAQENIKDRYTKLEDEV